MILWLKPEVAAGVLAHVSSTAVGTGWCIPFLGYDADKRLVAQLFHGTDAKSSSFTILTDKEARRP